LEASETGQRPTLRVVVEGQSRLLDPIVGDDVYFVAREALRNALRHGRAAEIEIELTFSRASFSMRIRDNGVGIDPAILREGRRLSHWGLPGMRERAQVMGAKLRVWSEQAAGTEIEVSIPGTIAYGSRPSHERSNAQGENE
jgi:signal transduction histidine kinase